MPYVDTARSLIRRSQRLYHLVERPYSRMVVARWQRRGAPIPAPSAVKRDMLRNVAREHDLGILIETGTYTGDTVMALHRDFNRIVSVELSPDLYSEAVRHAGNLPNVELRMGDSVEVLPEILATLREPALFWLDAHYSGGVTAMGNSVSPISSELGAILEHSVKGHVVLVDDAREFHEPERSGYPSADVVVDAALQHDYIISEKSDVFYLIPKYSKHSRSQA